MTWDPLEVPSLVDSMKVLIVDDSVVFRTQISSALSEVKGIELTGTAANGRIALQKLNATPVDLMTLDMEMPDMDGIETLKALKALPQRPRVIVFSSQSARGADLGLTALKEGADDVVVKPNGDQLNFENALDAIKTKLIPRVLQFADEHIKTINSFGPSTRASRLKSDSGAHREIETTYVQKPILSYEPKILVIASSTGGPPALEYIFSRVPGPYSFPIVIAQHMPPIFTQMLAKRLGEMTGVPSQEARNLMSLKSNNIYVAPGDFHLRVTKLNDELYLKIDQSELRHSVRPSADFLFESTAEIFGANALGMVLTGMGEDGCEGAQAIKKAGGGIMIQDKKSCTVFGMPGAVFDCGAYDEMGNLDHIVDKLNSILKGN